MHTPNSIYHNYGGGDDVWERFIAALEALPFSVIGINDYLFLDGYRKVLEYKSRGRLRNIATILPVVEFRVDRFAGTEKKLRRINFHVIFSNDVSSDVIEQQFLSRLSASYKLSPDSKAQWSGVITRDSLKDLGNAIIGSVPDDKRAEFGTPMLEGFNNLNLPVSEIKKALDSPYFRGNHITAIGKTEWSTLEWNDASIAEKKNLINEADVVFVAAESAAAYDKARASLRSQCVLDRLLDCSDAHHWSDSGEKDSLGRCELWLKADPTFRGLQHALLEFDERVYVGSEPPKVADVRNRPHRYIEKVEVRKIDRSPLDEQWFNFDLVLNPGLVAIIGNKGSGKSALADIVALGGNSQRCDHFSFLNANKFKNPRVEKASHFSASLTWSSGDKANFNLGRGSDPQDEERVRYIPQSYLETLCNEFAQEGSSAFDLELRSVIFSHIPAAERLGKGSLDALLAYLGEETLDRVSALKGELAKANREIAVLEEEASPERRRELDKRLAARLKEVGAMKAAEPKAVPAPHVDAKMKLQVDEIQKEIDKTRNAISELEKQFEADQKARRVLLTKIAMAEKLMQRIRNVEEAHRVLAMESAEELQHLGLQLGDMVKVAIDLTALRGMHSEAVSQDAMLKKSLDVRTPGGTSAQLAEHKGHLATLQSQLDAPTRMYQEFVTAHKEWQASVARVESDPDNSDSIVSLREELRRVAELPAAIAQREVERMRLCRQIYDELAASKEHYKRLYRPVQDFIQQHKTLADSIQLSFDVRIGERGLADALADWINKAKVGSFQGAEEGGAVIRAMIERADFDSVDGVESFLSELMRSVHADMRQTEPRAVSTASQLKVGRTVAGFYDVIFGLDYLRPRYALKMEGKELVELSPGERGLLLLLFYLLVEKNESPLILDQPEENLDNETVHEVLVPSIRTARRRRQIIIVTHNPNLAVVADADQVVCASIDKKDLCKVSYESGALESYSVNKYVVRYLEGTLPAFMNRDGKYIR